MNNAELNRLLARPTQLIWPAVKVAGFSEWNTSATEYAAAKLHTLTDAPPGVHEYYHQTGREDEGEVRHQGILVQDNGHIEPCFSIGQIYRETYQHLVEHAWAGATGDYLVWLAIYYIDWNPEQQAFKVMLEAATGAEPWERKHVREQPNRKLDPRINHRLLDYAKWPNEAQRRRRELNLPAELMDVEFVH